MAIVGRLRYNDDGKLLQPRMADLKTAEKATYRDDAELTFDAGFYHLARIRIESVSADVAKDSECRLLKAYDAETEFAAGYREIDRRITKRREGPEQYVITHLILYIVTGKPENTSRWL